jgi:MerR family transcriptional regulator, light-induced transcriptional regulator
MSLVTTQSEHAPGGAGVEPMLSVAAVARRLGIAPATLRTWDRRYGLGPTDHTTGRHRRYGVQDIARLELMQRALLRGASPSEAARYALTTALPDQRSTVVAPEDSTDEPLLITGGEFDAEEDDLAGTGGRVLRLPGAGRRARGLGRAALAMDAVSVQSLLADAVAEDGVMVTWNTMIRPVLMAIAQRWRHSGEGVEVEHLFSQCVTASLSAAAVGAPLPVNPRPVLLACVPEEQHTLPLHALNTALAQRGVGSLMLGAALPADALAASVRRIAPAAVFLWAQLPRYADCQLLSAMPKTRQRIRLFVGGPGWISAKLPAHAEPLGSLSTAVDRISYVLLGAP